MIYMLLQSEMSHYMLGQLHAYYIILHAFTVDSMQLQAFHANSVGPWDFEMTFELLERRLINNFEPYKGEDSYIVRGQHSCMMSMSALSGRHLHTFTSTRAPLIAR